MQTSPYLAFALGMIVLAATPGIGVVTVISRTLAQGLLNGFAFLTGLIIGDMVLMNAAIFGISSLAQVMHSIMPFIRYAGAAYMIWLGVQSFAQSVMPIAYDVPDKRTLLSEVMVGFAVTCGNPKPLLFYGAIMPNLMDVNALKTMDMIMFSVILASVSYSVVGAYAVIAHKARQLFISPKKMSSMNRISGVMLIGVGVVMALM